jgi:hypothetical protein
MSDIFREVDEALEKEKVAKIWAEYGPVIMGAILALVLGTAGWTGFNAWKTAHHEKATNALILALEGDSAKEVETALTDFVQTAKGDSKIAAQFRLAAIKAQEQDFKSAADLYAQIKDQTKDSKSKALASLFYVRSMVLDSPDTDVKPLIAILEPIAKDKTNPFSALAALETAVLYGEGLKDYDQALALLNGFEDANISASLKEKANALIHVYRQQSTTSSPQTDKTESN